MKHMGIGLLALSMSLVALVATVSAQSTLWVASRNADLKAEPRASAVTVSEMPVGTRLSVMRQEGKWYQVSTSNGKSGWIYRGKVSRQAPAQETEKEEGGIGDLLSGLGGSSIQADKTDASRSIRGLSPEAQAYAQQTGTPAAYQKAVDKVLARKTRDREVEQFLKNGKVGEYAE